ncbi:hypothetical protein [Plantactinospora sp. CA-290183]|uniref:hypothetical protein n=1 Tax=Plantactinospora sp. CA-290183 TaxID=3240006 RepID=UPI003D8EA273
MTEPQQGSLAAAPLPPFTDQPVHLGRLPIGTHVVTVWADRPARRLTRVMLADPAGRACGDGTLHGDTLTVTLPGDWNAADRSTATCLIARLIHQDDAAAGQAPTGARDEARRAVNVGRVGMVVPGSVPSAVSADCHELLRSDPRLRPVADVDQVRPEAPASRMGAAADESNS